MTDHSKIRMFKIGICDSNIEVIKKYTDFLEEWLKSEKKKYQQTKLKIYGFLKKEEIDEYLKNGQNMLDLLIQDIEMEKKDGIKTTEEIKKGEQNVVVVFLTDHIQCDLESRLLTNTFYCLKDNMEEWLPIMIDKLWQMEKGDEEILEWSWRKKKNMIPIKDIIYCERDLRITYLYYTGGNVKCHLKLDELEEKLNRKKKNFCRCHNSFLVNLSYVEKIEKDGLILSDGDILPISRSRKKETLKHYEELKGNQIIF